MPIRMKRSATAGAIPDVSQIVSGELAVNTADGKLFLKTDSEEVVEIGRKAGVIVTSANVQAETGDDIVSVATTAISVTLPSGPDAGDAVSVARSGPGLVTILRNGATIHNTADDLVIDQENRRVRLIYAGGTWRVSMEAIFA